MDWPNSMIICSQCHHQNPDGIQECQACCAPLSTEASCPSCGQHHPNTARFCGHCGYALADEISGHIPKGVPEKFPTLNIPDPMPPDPMIDLYPSRQLTAVGKMQSARPTHPPQQPQRHSYQSQRLDDELEAQPHRPKAALIHQSTQFKIQLDRYHFPIHLGKPNRKTMPDIDLSAFKNSAIVSRIHADIAMKNNTFFIRDSGSANGTFVNEQQIPPGQIQWLSSGDKISFGQGDLVTFIFELS